MKLVSTPPEKVDAKDITRAVILFKSLFRNELAPQETYLPYYLLERSLLGYQRWIIPMNKDDPKTALSYDGGGGIAIPLFSEPQFYEASPFLSESTPALKPGITAISYAMRLQIGTDKRGGILFNHDAHAFEKGALFLLENFVLPAAVIANDAFRRLSRHLVDPQHKIHEIIVRTIARSRYYVVVTRETKSTAPMIQMQRDAYGSRLALYAGVDLALAASREFAKEHSLAENEVRLVPITLPEAIKQYTKAGGLSDGPSLDGLQFYHGFGPTLSQAESMAFDRAEQFVQLAASAGIDLLKSD